MKKTFTAVIVSFTSFFAFSLAVSAQSMSVAGIQQGAGTFSSIVTTFNVTIVRSLGLLLMAIAMVAFFWGIVQYLLGIRKGEAKAIKDGNQFVVWSLVALFVMFSVYGIIRLAQNFAFQGQDMTSILIPNLNFQSGGIGGMINGNQSSGASPTSGIDLVTPPTTNGNPSTGAPTPNTNGNPGSGAPTPNTNGNPSTSQQSANNEALLTNGAECGLDNQCQSSNCYVASPTGLGTCMSDEQYTSTRANASPQEQCYVDHGVWHNNTCVSSSRRLIPSGTAQSAADPTTGSTLDPATKQGVKTGCDLVDGILQPNGTCVSGGGTQTTGSSATSPSSSSGGGLKLPSPTSSSGTGLKL